MVFTAVSVFAVNPKPERQDDEAPDVAGAVTVNPAGNVTVRFVEIVSDRLNRTVTVAVWLTSSRDNVTLLFVVDVEKTEPTVNIWLFEMPPPGAGLKTVMGYVPGVTRSDAGMVAVSCVAAIYVVVRSEPLKRTTDPVTKLLPFTVSVKVALPGAFAVGAMDEVDGTRLLTVNVWLFEAPPPGEGLKTSTGTVAAAVRSVAGMVAVTCVGLT